MKAIRESDAFTRESKNYLDAFALALIPLVYGACYIPESLARVRMHEKQLSHSSRQDPKVWEELVKPMENLMGTTMSLIHDIAGLVKNKSWNIQFHKRPEIKVTAEQITEWLKKNR